jgi:hypothetical protein
VPRAVAYAFFSILILAEPLPRSPINLGQNDDIVTRGTRFREVVLEELGRHGLRPGPLTTAEQLRDALRDLYRYEIRRLRSELLAGRIPRANYAARVLDLRRRYPLLSLPTEFWVDPAPPPLG